MLRQRPSSHPHRPGAAPSARPDLPPHNRAPPWAWPEPCGTTSSYLAGGDPGPTMGRQSRVERKESPAGLFLCGPLCFLSGCHLPKVMALWGTGGGEVRGPSWGGAEISRSRSLHSSEPGPAQTGRCRPQAHGVVAQGRAQVTQWSQYVLGRNRETGTGYTHKKYPSCC